MSLLVGELYGLLKMNDKEFFNSLSSAETKFRDLGSKMTDIGKSLTMKVTTPIVGVGLAAFKVGSDFEAGMSKVKAISGATGEDFVKLKEKAKEMGATTKFSATQSSEALQYMAMAGWDTQKMLDGLPGVMSLAAASGEDLATVSDIVTDAMTAFGMEASRAGEFADTLAAASSNANTNVAILGESFKYVAPVAGALGFTAKDTAVALGLMANAGIKGSQAGTAMRSMISRLVKPTKESKTAMDQLGISITKSDGTMKSLEEITQDLREAFKDLDPEQKAFYAAQIAGQEAMSGLLAIVNASDEDYNNLANAIENSTGAAQRMSEEMQENLQGNITKLKSAFEGLLITLYERLAPSFTKIVEVISKFVEWLSNLSPAAQKIAIVIAGIAAAIGPVLIALGALSGAISAIVGVLPILGGAIAAILSPIGLVVIAIAALALAWIKWGDDVKAVVGKVASWISEKWQAISSATSSIWNSIMKFLSDWWPTLLAIITGPVGLIVKLIYDNWDSIKAFTLETWSNIQKSLKDLWEKIFKQVKETWNKIKNFLVDIGNQITGVFDGIVNNAFSWGKNLIGNFVRGIKAMWDTLTETIGGVAGMIGDFLGFSSPTKKGPGSEADKWAPNFMKMFLEGVDKGLPELKASIEKMSFSLNPTGQLAMASGGTEGSREPQIIYNYKIYPSDYASFEREMARRGARVGGRV